MDFFLTTDFKLVKQVSNLGGSALSSLKVKVVSPVQFAEQIGLKGIKESEIRLLRRSAVLAPKKPDEDGTPSLSSP